MEYGKICPYCQSMMIEESLIERGGSLYCTHCERYFDPNYNWVPK